jgi:hypothetical protein
MNTKLEDLLAAVAERGVLVWVNGNTLSLCPRNRMTPELRADLIANKAALVELLRARAIATAGQVLRGEFDNAQLALRMEIARSLHGVDHPSPKRALNILLARQNQSA